MASTPPRHILAPSIGVHKIRARSYLKNGLLDAIAYSNGTRSTFSHDDANRIESINNHHEAVQVSSFFYAYDKNGNRTLQVENQFGLASETTTYA